MEIGEHLLLLGPNRRSDRTMVEQQLLPSGSELEALASRGGSLVGWLLAQYPQFGVPSARCT